MNDRMGRPSRSHHQPQDLQSQVGFYLLPPDHQGGSKSKKKSRSKGPHGGHHGSRRWASQNHLDAITEASDESRPNSPGGDPHHQRGQGPAWNSSPGRLVRDHTSMSQRGLFGDVQVPNVDMAATSKLVNCRHPQGRICENLRHGLQQLKYRGQRDAYKAIIDAIVVGPEAVRTAEAEDILGLNPDSVLRARARNRDVAGMQHNLDDNDTGTSGFEFDNPYDQDRKRNNRRLFMSMRDLFVHFSRYGDPHASGQHITLSQSDKWMKQAGVIDNWNVTATDTAIAFRKISRGSKYLEYEPWKVFLEELAYRKRIGIDVIQDKLLAAGKPGSQNQISVQQSEYPNHHPQQHSHQHQQPTSQREYRRSRHQQQQHHQQQYHDY